MTAAGVLAVARQEFRLRIRAGRWRTVLLAWVAVLLVFTLLLASATDDLAVQSRGAVVHGGLLLLVLGLALLVVPSLAAQSVNGDRERGTLAALQVTRLTPADIVLGKFTAAWGTALLFLLLTVPLALYATTQGGVPLGRLLSVLAVLGLLLALLALPGVATTTRIVLSQTALQDELFERLRGTALGYHGGVGRPRAVADQRRGLLFSRCVPVLFAVVWVVLLVLALLLVS